MKFEIQIILDSTFFFNKLYLKVHILLHVETKLDYQLCKDLPRGLPSILLIKTRSKILQYFT